METNNVTKRKKRAIKKAKTIHIDAHKLLKGVHGSLSGYISIPLSAIGSNKADDK